MSRLPRSRRYICPQDFRDLRRGSGLTRKDAAAALDVTQRTIQNWENSGARIPWMAYRMLRILRGYALPGQAWEGWTVRGGELISPAGQSFDAAWLQDVGNVFAQARLWRLMYSRSGRAKTASTVIPFPDRRRTPLPRRKNRLRLNLNAQEVHIDQESRLGGLDARQERAITRCCRPGVSRCGLCLAEAWPHGWQQDKKTSQAVRCIPRGGGCQIVRSAAPEVRQAGYCLRHGGREFRAGFESAAY